MIKLNRMTDYAVVILSSMAKGDDEKASATRIAQRTGIPTASVAKILHLLAGHGLVTAQRGVAGGYGLSATPRDISVAAIIEAMEGPIALTACVEGAVDMCSAEGICPMRGNWEQVNRAMRASLSAVSLQDMLPSWSFLNAEGQNSDTNTLEGRPGFSKQATQRNQNQRNQKTA